MKEPMKEPAVNKTLLNKFSMKNGYAAFNQITTWTPNYTRIDLYVVGLYARDTNVYAIEIKVDKGDFIKDITEFERKQGKALESSNLFYYACPHGLIQPNEVPDNAGLYWITNGGRVLTKKVAPYRAFVVYPLEMLRRVAEKTCPVHASHEHYVKFLGKEMTEEEVNAYIENEVDRRFQRRSTAEENTKARMMAESMITSKLRGIDNYEEKKRIADEYRSLLNQINYHYAGEDPRRTKEILRRLGKLLKNFEDVAEMLFEK